MGGFAGCGGGGGGGDGGIHGAGGGGVDGVGGIEGGGLDGPTMETSKRLTPETKQMLATARAMVVLSIAIKC